MATLANPLRVRNPSLAHVNLSIYFKILVFLILFAFSNFFSNNLHHGMQLKFENLVNETNSNASQIKIEIIN